MSEYLNLLGGDYLQISGAMIRRFGLITGGVYSQLVLNYRGFIMNPETMKNMKEIDGKKYFYKPIEDIGDDLRLSKHIVTNALKELEEAGLLIINRKVKTVPKKNYYFLTDRIEQVMKEDHELQIATALEKYRLKEEKAGTPAAEIARELEKLEEMLRGNEFSIRSMKYKVRRQKFKIKVEKPEEAAEAAAAAQAIDDMLPTGMLEAAAAAEPEPFASEPLEVEAEPVPLQQERKPAADKRAAKRAAERIIEDRKEVLETPGLDNIYTYIQNSYKWHDESIIELCLWLKDSGKHMYISRGDIDKGFLDYKAYEKPVSKPSRFVGACIETRLMDRLAKQGIDLNELEQGLQVYEFIEKYRAINPDHPMVLKYDQEQNEKGFALA